MNALSDCHFLESIYERYSKRVYTYCYKMTANVHAAQELMQDTFVRFFEKCGRMTLQDNELPAYIFKIAHNLCVDYIRRECRFSSIKAMLSCPVSTAGIEEHAVSSYYSDVMGRCLDALTPVQKSIVVFHIVEDLTHGQIASVLNMSEAAVRKQYQRSKSKIRRMLEKEGIVNGEGIGLV